MLVGYFAFKRYFPLLLLWWMIHAKRFVHQRLFPWLYTLLIALWFIFYWSLIHFNEKKRVFHVRAGTVPLRSGLTYCCKGEKPSKHKNTVNCALLCFVSLSHMHTSSLLSTHCKHTHTSSSFTVWSVSIGSSPSVVFTVSTEEALDTLKTPWMLTRTFTLTFAHSPDSWGTTFWIKNWPVR